MAPVTCGIVSRVRVDAMVCVVLIVETFVYGEVFFFTAAGAAVGSGAERVV